MLAYVEVAGATVIGQPFRVVGLLALDEMQSGLQFGDMRCRAGVVRFEQFQALANGLLARLLSVTLVIGRLLGLRPTF